MYLNELQVSKLRNLQPVHLTFSPHVNYLFGDNAQGKTNLIEAIYLLCLAKSFRTRDERELIPFDDHEFLLEGKFHDDEQLEHRVVIHHEISTGKKISVDGKRLSQFSKLVGQFPIICLSTGDHEITSGPPAQRRRFFNVLLSQCSSRYLDDLKQYEQILKQRNAILQRLTAAGKEHKDELEIWNHQFTHFGTQIIKSRRLIVNELNQYLADYYLAITKNKWTLRINYKPNVEDLSDEELAIQFSGQLKKMASREMRQGVSLVGPHRDEFQFLVSDRELRLYGSRGEHKSALVSLKAAEAAVLHSRTQICPIMLLDDLLAELDQERCATVISLFEKGSQIFITGTTLDYHAFQNIGGLSKNPSLFFVENGTLTRMKNAENSASYRGIN